MATTILGGYYADADGNLHNATGEPLTKDAVKQAEAHATAQQAQRAEAERQQVLLQAQRDPIARALLHQQAASQVSAASKP
jgi:hypothetical protein